MAASDPGAALTAATGAAETGTDPCNHCQKPILWVLSLRNNVATPVDAEPVGDGNLLLSRGPGGRWYAGVASKAAAAGARAAGQPTYVHHARTCPFAAAWNKPRPATGRGGRAQRRRES